MRKLRTEGLAKTFSTVNYAARRAQPVGLQLGRGGVAVGGLVEGIRPGDRVACGGVGYANHAEFAVVPKNLVVKVPDRGQRRRGCLSPRWARLRCRACAWLTRSWAKRCWCWAWGCWGRSRCRLLRANGCRVLGTDLDASLVSLAESFGAIGRAGDEASTDACRELTAGHGVDAVLVCAGTSSNQPIELCGRITREKGRVVVVGAVRMDIPREDFFKKEISVVISRSYGPGRYDPRLRGERQRLPAGLRALHRAAQHADHHRPDRAAAGSTCAA